MENGRLKGILNANSILTIVDTGTYRLKTRSPLEIASSKILFTTSDTLFFDFLKDLPETDFDHIVITKSTGAICIIPQEIQTKILEFKRRMIRDVLQEMPQTPTVGITESCLSGLELLSHENTPYIIAIDNDSPTGFVTREEITWAINRHKNLWALSIADIAQKDTLTIDDSASATQAIIDAEEKGCRFIICRRQDDAFAIIEPTKLVHSLAEELAPLITELKTTPKPQPIQWQLRDVLIERAIGDTMNIGVIALSANLDVQYCNTTALDLLNFTHDSVYRKNVRKMAKEVPFFDHIRACIEALDPIRKPVVDLNDDPNFPANFQTKISGVWDNRTPHGFIVTIQDSTDIRLAETKLRKLAYYDALTGLPNRTLLFERLSMEIKKSARSCESFAVIFADLDGFKGINDTHGHRVGDELLSMVAERFTDALRDSDTVARLGGDEFLFILPGAQTKEMVNVVIYKVLTSIQQPFLINDIAVNISVSFGTAYYPEDGSTPEELIEYADKRMYSFKKESDGS